MVRSVSGQRCAENERKSDQTLPPASSFLAQSNVFRSPANIVGREALQSDNLMLVIGSRGGAIAGKRTIIAGNYWMVPLCKFAK